MLVIIPLVLGGKSKATGFIDVKEVAFKFRKWRELFVI